MMRRWHFALADLTSFKCTQVFMWLQPNNSMSLFPRAAPQSPAEPTRQIYDICQNCTSVQKDLPPEYIMSWFFPLITSLAASAAYLIFFTIRIFGEKICQVDKFLEI